MLFPKDEFEFARAIEISRKLGLKTFILGCGSNTLFDEDFFDGVVITTNKMNSVKNLGDAIVEVGAGTNLFFLNQKLAQFGLGGLEWSYGIPASFGGFVYMNGGAFGSEIKNFIKSVAVLDNGKIHTLEKQDLHFSYRNSALGERIVLSAKLQLFDDKQSKIEENMQNFLEKKKSLQPYDMPSLGSVYKRIFRDNVVYPAKLIDSLALKGVKIGGVEISPKHAGFFVNCDGGTWQDYAKLCEFVENAVFVRYGVRLEREEHFLSEVGK
jgi:UDP-N-acetylmuramate dehydrogenase